MKVLHTSDWHLGKKIYKIDRLQEHQLFLDWLLEQIQKQDIDVLLIAGDIFDVPSPPHQSLEQFYQFLARLSSETTCDTYIISGNHDSGILLEAPKALLKSHRVKVWGKISPFHEDHWVSITKKNTTIELCGIPFFRSYELTTDHEANIFDSLQKYLTKESAHRKILLLHHLAGMYEAAGSEHVISLSGIDSIPKDWLQSFFYVALGHIHKPQKISENAYYSGSPLQLRFSEKNEKSVYIIDLEASSLAIDKKNIPSFRTLLNLTLDELNWENEIEKISVDCQLTPLFEIYINLKEPNITLMDKIKEKISEMKGELVSLIPIYDDEENEKEQFHHVVELGPVELFKEFYLKKFPKDSEVSQEILQHFKKLLERAKNETSST